MKRKQLRLGKGFNVIFGNAQSQAAQIMIEPGKAEGGPRNRHRGADQWLYVVSGQGVAKSGERRLLLRAGTLLLIEHGDRHEIRNNGQELLKTLNFYVPSAYIKSGEELLRAQPYRSDDTVTAGSYEDYEHRPVSSLYPMLQHSAAD